MPGTWSKDQRRNFEATIKRRREDSKRPQKSRGELIPLDAIPERSVGRKGPRTAQITMASPQEQLAWEFLQAFRQILNGGKK
jgi:hypothetical protein